MSTLRGKGAVVTGGGRGIGRAIAHSLARSGARVVLASRTQASVEAVAGELTGQGYEAFCARCDVTDSGSVKRLAESAEKWVGRVDILINNAGAAHSASLSAQTLEDWNRIFAVNATSAFLCTQAFLPAMMERKWGRIVNVASIAGLFGARYISAYSAAKHAVVGFTRSVAAETAGSGVTCNAVCPGYVDTDMTRESVERIVARTGRSHEEALQAILAVSGQRSLIAPEKVSDVVLSLCDDETGRTSGAAIVIDGAEPPRGYELINPEVLGAPRGWSNGVLAPRGGRVLMVAGQTAPSGNFVDQWRGALEKVLTVVDAAGGKPEHIGRMTIYVTDRAAYLANLKPLGEVHRQLMGRHYPAMALVDVRALVDPNAQVEIEATAVLP